MSKICPRCHRDDVVFGVRTKKGKLTEQPYCKECNREYHKEHYKANKAAYTDANKQRIKRNQELFLAWVSGRKCKECSEDDILVLELDHRDPSKKLKNVSKMLREGHSWESILAETEKCDLLCANCHKRRTAKQQGWYKLALSSIG